MSFFVQFSWRLHISANVFSGELPQARRRPKYCFQKTSISCTFHFLLFLCTRIYNPKITNPHSNSLPVNNDGRTTVERRSNDGRAKIRQHSNRSETAVIPYHNVTSVYYKNLLQTVLNGQKPLWHGICLTVSKPGKTRRNFKLNEYEKDCDFGD